MTQYPVIIFDGVCNLCCGWVRFLIHADKKELLRFSPMQSDYAKIALESIGLNPGQINTVVYIKGKRHYTESNAALEILKDLGGIWHLFAIFRIIPRFMRDFVYRIVARSRYRIFGKKNTCMVPSPALQKRFYS